MYIIWIVNTCNGTIVRNRQNLEYHSNKVVQDDLVASMEEQYDEQRIHRMSSHDQVMISLLGPKEDPGYDSTDFSLVDESGDER